MADTNEIKRQLFNFPPDIWGDYFLSLPFNYSEFESYSKQVEALKEEVEDMLMASPSDPLDKIYLINSLCRLHVWYHFETEIQEQLGHLFLTLTKSIDDNDYDLYTVAVIFQVFRDHGYKVSCDVFNKFPDDDGKFKEALIGDIKGMVSLYEASQFRMNGEHILDEALSFTTKHLEYYCSLNLENQSISHLREYIVNALKRPYRRGIPRLEARQYISFYEKDESRDDILLKFAKFDFNRLQMLHRQELVQRSKHEFKVSLHKTQTRGGSFCGVGYYFEPCYGRARNILTKHAVIIGMIDDTYEAFGLYQELEYLTNAINRFDISAMDELPADYLKNIYETILNVHDDAENYARNEGRSYSISYAKDEFKKFVIAQQVQARWRHEGYLPTFDEYLENGGYGSGAIAFVVAALIGMEEANKNAYEWVINRDNKMHRAFAMATRFYNDIVTNEVEEKRGLLSGTACYMKQYNVSREEATKAFREKIEAIWKDVNEFCMRPSPVPMPIIRLVVNVFGLLDVTYKYDDEFTNQVTTFKHYITQMFIDPIPIEED